MASALLAKPCLGLRSSQLTSARRARVVAPVRAMADKAQVSSRRGSGGREVGGHRTHFTLQPRLPPWGSQAQPYRHYITTYMG